LRNRGELTAQQQQGVEQSILQRAVVLAKGAIKRDKKDVAQIYGMAEKGEWNEMARAMQGLVLERRDGIFSIEA